MSAYIDFHSSFLIGSRNVAFISRLFELSYKVISICTTYTMNE